MARKTDGQGHNSGDPLTDDEKAALLHRHMVTIRMAQKAAERSAAREAQGTKDMAGFIGGIDGVPEIK
jgi:hypothetical protein